MKSMHAVLLSLLTINSLFRGLLRHMAVVAFLKCAFIVMILLSPAYSFALTQPNGSPIPSNLGCNGVDPTGLAAVFACSCTESGICNIGAWCAEGTCPDGQNGICETTLYHTANDDSCIPSHITGLNPQAAAATEPETLYPSVTLKFTLLSRGTAIFQNVFGWYNVTGSAPSPDDLHVILDCTAAAGSSVTVDIKNDPAWAGGAIGFFIITPESHASPGNNCDGGNCCATINRLKSGAGYAYYSQKSFNPDNAGSNSVIHLLIYQSMITDSKFYFAWEDIKGGQNTDFTDLVTAVEGVSTSPADNSGIFPWFLLPKHRDGGCHSHAAGGGISGGLMLALTAAFLTRTRKRGD